MNGQREKIQQHRCWELEKTQYVFLTTNSREKAFSPWLERGRK